MGLRETIRQDQIQAMKNRDENKLSILRMLSAAIQNEEIAQGGQLTDEAVEAVAARQKKQLADALPDFIKGGREDLVAKTQSEIDILRNYLPRQLEGEELKAEVRKILIANNLLAGGEPAGRAIGLVMKEIKGRADGNQVKEIVSELLAGQN